MKQLEKLLESARYAPTGEPGAPDPKVMAKVDSFLADEWSLTDVVEMTIDDEVAETSMATNVGSGTARALSAPDTRLDFLQKITKAFHKYRKAGGGHLHDFLTQHHLQLNDDDLAKIKSMS